MKLYYCLANHLTKLDVKTIVTIQVIVNEKKHDLSMLIDKKLRLVTVISFPIGIERYI